VPPDIDEQADERDRPGANPWKKRKPFGWLWQKSQILGYNAKLFRHLLALPSRCKIIEGRGEDFFCVRVEARASQPRKPSKADCPPRTILLPSRPNLPVSVFLKRLLGKEKRATP
jgi:hypothetical protein